MNFECRIYLNKGDQGTRNDEVFLIPSTFNIPCSIVHYSKDARCYSST